MYFITWLPHSYCPLPAEAYGGALFVHSGSVDLLNINFTENNAGVEGLAVAVYGGFLGTGLRFANNGFFCPFGQYSSEILVVRP